MFQAGAVLPSSVLLLHELTEPPVARPPLASVFGEGAALEGLMRPEYAALLSGLKAMDGGSGVLVLVPRGRMAGELVV